MEYLTLEESGFDYSGLITYSGYYKNDDCLLSCASGGAVSAISEAIIKRGGVVFGVSYSDDFKRAEWKCVDNVEDLWCLRGSKYCDTVKEIVINGEAKSLYSVFEEKIKKDRLVLFVGLGCDVAALKLFCDSKNIDTEKLYTVEIICHGPTYAMVQRQYIEELEHKYNSKIIDFSARYKKDGWTPAYIHAEFDNGYVYEVPFTSSEFHFAFAHLSKNGCYNCKFKGQNHKADIACGDFWGLTKNMSGWNDNGVSVLFVQSQKGNRLIQMIDENIFHLEPADTKLALENNPLYYQCRYKDKYHDKFEEMLKKHGLHYAVEHYPTNFRNRLRREIKKILKRTSNE